MKTIYYLILLSANFCFSQDTISLAKQDTVYIILPEREASITLQLKNFKFITYGNRELNEVKFMLKEGHPISLITRKDSKDNKRVKRKTFLQENKEKIIDLKFIETYTPKRVLVYILGNLDHRKVIYLIDESQMKKRKINLKKAYLNLVGYVEM